MAAMLPQLQWFSQGFVPSLQTPLLPSQDHEFRWEPTKQRLLSASLDFFALVPNKPSNPLIVFMDSAST
jgi:hypothetical protein